MVNNILIITLISFLCFSPIGWAKEKKKDAVVFVKKDPGGYSLSVNAHNVMLEEIIKELTEKCNIRVVVYEKAIISLPVSVSFKELRLEEGIKRVVKAAGVKSHLITYREGKVKGPEIVEISLLGSGKKGKGLTFSRESVKPEKKVKAETPSQGEFSDKVELFKARYQWEDTDTQELAGHILEMMPDAAKEPGLEELARGLDRIVGEGEEVDEKTLYQAIESSVPPNVAPVMMKAIKESAEQYKSGDGGKSSNKSSNKLYQSFMDRNRKNRRESRLREE